MTNDLYARYDYAWRTPGWTAQDPEILIEDTNLYNDPGLPDDVSKVLVSGTFMDQDTGRALEGVVEVRTTEVLTYTPTLTQVMPGVRRFRFIHGVFSTLLAATDDPQLSPVGWKYQFRVTVKGHVTEFETTLPSTPAEVDILTLFEAAT